MNEREFTIDDLSSPYGQEDVSYFAYGGPVGESMQNEIQPAMQYFSEGGEVDDESPDEDEVEDIGEIPSRPVVPQEFSKGGLAKKAAQLLKDLGVAESKVAGKELTTMQDFHTSLGDSIRERAAKMQQQMDAMQFKYGPGQYVFTEGSAKNNRPPLLIKAKHLYGNHPMREPHPENPLLGKVIKDPATGRATRTPYEPGYLVRREGPEGQWSEFVIPESAIKGAVDGFSKGGAVKGAAKALKDVVVSIPGKLSEVEKYLSEKHGASEAKRLQRAADEVKNLENQYTAEALKEVFRGDNTKPLLVVADPARFQDFAARLKEPYRPAVERYWREMSAKGGGAEYVPYLRLNKDAGKLPYVSGHEGRHRNLAMQELGYPSTIWQIMTQGELREPLRRRTREEYLKDLFDLIGERPLVIPESRWTPETKDKMYVEERVRDWKKARTLPEPFKHGGPVNRAQGSPIYGEIPDSGPITADTRAAFKAKGPSAASVVSESARMLRNITGEGVSNLESRIRGSVATIPGTFGDIESIFRESDKTRKLATTEEVLRDYMPGRLTKPTKEAKGFEELGTYLPLAIPAGTVTKTAGAVKTGARKALEELGPTAGSILERAVPKFGILPEGPSAPTNLAQRVEQGKFFKGRLDDFVSQVRNPVTKQQFLGSLKGKFREYDISRAAQALADLDDAAKLTPTDLVSRVSAVATPNRYKTTFIEPKTSGLHNNYDNVYGATGQPVGVINLAYEPTRAAVEAEEASAAARSAAAALGRGSGDTEKVQALASFLETSEDLAKTPERRAQLIAGVNNLNAQLSALQADALPALQGIQDIKFLDIPEYKGNWSKLINERTKAIPFERNTQEYRDAYKKIDDQLTTEIKMRGLQRLRQENPLVNTMLNRMATQEFSPPYKSADDMLQEVATGRFSSDNEVLPYLQRLIRTDLEDSSKAILVDNKALLDDVLKETQRYSTYRGSHTAVNPEKNAMGFSRFTEHQVNVPGLGRLEGIYVSELQSDMFRDIKKLGKKGGSAAKDKQEVTSLFDGIKTRLDPLRQQIEDRFGSMDSFMFVLRGDMTGKADPAAFSDFLTTLGPISKGKADQIATDTVKDVKRITKLQERLGLPGGQVKGTYDIEEPIANIEVQPQVVQQLLAKNAIAGAMKMNKSFVAFPGTESKQAKLYEKLPNNLKAVVKDLGEGFVIQPITIKDATGVERSHWAVLWDNNAAQRVLNQGVPFKKGGLVEKSAMNNRRYI
jgi:hypothetical protein